MAPPDDEHNCGWKAYAKAQDQKLAEVLEQLEVLKRQVFGKKSEKRMTSKMPPPVVTPATPSAAEKKRADLRALRDAKLETEVVDVPVPKDECTCPRCGNTRLRTVGDGKPSTVYEFVQPHFRRRIYRRQTLACNCGHMVCAPAPDRIGEKTRYAASFVAHLVVSKCGDSIPQYRLEKAYKHLGIPISRSTMADLFHRAAKQLRPLWSAAVALVPNAADVHADETSFRQQDTSKRPFVWSFVTPDLVVYQYAQSRSGDTPKAVLGDSQGHLVVDQFTGDNDVTAPGKRARAGCMAHARRKLFEQREHPETNEPLELIRQMYLVERDAKERDIVGTEAHLTLRQQRSRPLFAKLLCWARRHRRRFEPRSAMGRATSYLIKHRRALSQFLYRATIPPDNNVAEASLRRVALGRANLLFVADGESGANLAVLYTLVASCEKHGISAIAYLTDVLTSVQGSNRFRLKRSTTSPEVSNVADEEAMATARASRSARPPRSGRRHRGLAARRRGAPADAHLSLHPDGTTLSPASWDQQRTRGRRDDDAERRRALRLARIRKNKRRSGSRSAGSEEREWHAEARQRGARGRLDRFVRRISGKDDGGVRLNGVNEILDRYAKCCNPVPGGEIMGFISRGRGITVHRRGRTKAFEADPERRVDIAWNSTAKTNRPVQLKVVTANRPGILATVGPSAAPCMASPSTSPKPAVAPIPMVAQ